MTLVLKDFDIFTFYTSKKETFTIDRAQTRMCEYLTKIMEINPRVRLELSRSTDSGFTIATIFEYLAGNKYSVSTYADIRENRAVINISKKEE